MVEKEFSKLLKTKIFPIEIEGTGFSELARVANVFNRKFSDRTLEKVSDHSNLKTLTFKQMPQGLSIALAQVKAVNTHENWVNEIRQIIYIFLSSKRNYYKSIQQYDEFNKVIKQNAYCIYEFWK